MKSMVALLVLSLSFHAYAQNPKAVTLRSVLLEQLRTSHSEKDWFVPIDVAVEVGRSVSVVGRSMRKNLNISRNLGYGFASWQARTTTTNRTGRDGN